MKNIRVFLYVNFQFLEVKFSVYLNRRVFVMVKCSGLSLLQTQRDQKFQFETTVL